MNDLADRRQEEKERRKAEILDAAEAVAASVGFDQMTMDEVGRRARLSRALLYVYFNDKSELLFGICERAMQVLHQRFAEAAARHHTGLEQVTACGRAYVAFAQEFPVYFDALARFEAHTPTIDGTGTNEAACVLAGDKVHGVMIRALENGIADGSVRPDIGAPALISVTLWGFMHGIIQLSSTKANVLAHDGISTRQLVDNALLLTARSLARNP